MPIVFAQPDPVAPQLSAAAGYAQEFAQLFPSIASLARASADRQQQGNFAAAQGYQQQQQANAGQSNQAAMQTQALQAQADMQGSAQAQHAAMPYIQADAQLQQEQATQQWMQSQAWTATDEAQLSQASNGWAQIQADPGLNDMEKQQAAQQYMPYIQQAQQRKQASQLLLQTQQQKLQAAQAAHLEGMNSLNTMNWGKTLKQSMFQDGDGNWVLPLPNGQVHVTPAAKEAKDTSGADEYKAQQDETKNRREDHKFWSAEHDKAIATVTKWEQEEDEIKNDEGKTISKKPKYPDLKNQETFDANVHKIMVQKGLGGDPEAFITKRAAERAARNGTPAASPQTQPTPTPQQEQPKIGAKANNTDQPPFEFNNGKRTQSQDQAVEAFNDYHKLITESNLWNTNRKDYQSAKDVLASAQKELERWGSEAAMDPGAKKFYDANLAHFNAVVGTALAEKKKAEQSQQPKVDPYNPPRAGLPSW